MTDAPERPPLEPPPTERRPADWLLRLAEAFPQTFFADPKRVQPLKINIHRDLNDWRKTQSLPAEIGLLPLRRFLHWYTKRRHWWRILSEGSRCPLKGGKPRAPRRGRRCPR